MGPRRADRGFRRTREGRDLTLGPQRHSVARARTNRRELTTAVRISHPGGSLWHQISTSPAATGNGRSSVLNARCARTSSDWKRCQRRACRPNARCLSVDMRLVREVEDRKRQQRGFRPGSASDVKGSAHGSAIGIRGSRAGRRLPCQQPWPFLGFLAGGDKAGVVCFLNGRMGLVRPEKAHSLRSCSSLRSSRMREKESRQRYVTRDEGKRGR